MNFSILKSLLPCLSATLLLGADLRIGRSFDSTDAAYIGHLDELKIWTTQLSPNQILTDQKKLIDQTHPNWASLRGYYQFNSSEADIVDSSKYGKNGIFSADLSQNSRFLSDYLNPAEFDQKCLVLSQKDYFSAPINSLSALSNFTIEIWYKADYISSDFAIFSTGDNSNGFTIKRRGNSGELVVEGQLAAGTYKTLPPNGKWHHLAFSFKGAENGQNNGEISCFVNGKAYFSTSTNLTDFTFPTALFCGISAYAVSDGLQGQVKEFRFWQANLSTETIKNHYLKVVDNSHPNFSDLKIHYPMNNSEQPLSDFSGNNLHGFINGTPNSVNFLTDAPEIADGGNITPEGFFPRWQPVIGSEKIQMDISESADFSDYITNWQNSEISEKTDKNVEFSLKLGKKLYYRLRSGITGSGNSEIKTVELAEKSLNFDGSSHALIPQTEELDFAEKDFTVEFWMKSDTVGNWPVMIANKSWNYAPAGFVIGGNSGKIIVNISDGTTNKNLESTTTVFDGKWHHIALTFDRDQQLKLFINGKADQTTEISGIGSISGDIGKIYLGCSNSSGSYYYNGNLDEIRFWSKVLTTEEIKSNLHRTLIGKESGLSAYYRLNNSEGNELIDSAKFNNGTLNNTQNGHGEIAPVGNSRSIQQSNEVGALWEKNSQILSGNSDFSATISDSSFQIIGHDNGTDTNSNQINSPLQLKIGRSWTVISHGSSQNTMTVNLADLGLIPNNFSKLEDAANYKLLKLGEDGNFAPVSADLSLNSENFTVTFSAVNLTDGTYSLGTTAEKFHKTAILSTEIVTNDNGTVAVNWTFSDEENVDKYSILLSSDGENWTKITEISPEQANNGQYQYLDENPLEGAFYQISVNGKDGGQITATTDAVGSLTVEYSLNLEKGWNLISLPCEVTDLSALKSKVKEMWCWAENSHYIRTKEPQPMQGIWVFCGESAENIKISGKKPKNCEISLSSGWNMIGPSAEEKQPENATVYHWQQSRYNQLQSEEKLIPLKGYWVHSE